MKKVWFFFEIIIYEVKFCVSKNFKKYDIIYMYRLRLISDSVYCFCIYSCGDYVCLCGIFGGSEGIGVYKIYC